MNEEWFSRGICTGRQIEVSKRDWIKEVLKANVKRQGIYYICKCPFHFESTSSCIYDPLEDEFHCLGCGEKGDGNSLAQALDTGDNNATKEGCKAGNFWVQAEHKS